MAGVTILALVGVMVRSSCDVAADGRAALEL